MFRLKYKTNVHTDSDINKARYWRYLCKSKQAHCSH